MDAREIFGHNLRKERTTAGLSQEALADACGMHMSEISRLERAVRDPRLSTIVRVAKALRIPPSRLLAGFD